MHCILPAGVRYNLSRIKVKRGDFQPVLNFLFAALLLPFATTSMVSKFQTSPSQETRRNGFRVATTATGAMPLTSAGFQLLIGLMKFDKLILS